MARFEGTAGPDTMNGSSDPDVIKGFAGDDQINGLAGDDDIEGGDGNDTIDGGLGADLMVGQAGNDTYYVDNPNDRIGEGPSAGVDRVLTMVEYALPNYVESMAVLDARSTGSINLYGNSDNNDLRGNDGFNLIDGREGADTMYGYGGDDAYYVDNARDVVYDGIVGGNDGGYDIIFTTVSYALGQNTGEYVERLAALDPNSTTNISLTGNSLDNEITGNNGNNMLDGGAGTDTLRGMGGDDTYLFYGGNNPDILVEYTNGGFDTVITAGRNFTLPENFEGLTGGYIAGQTIYLNGNNADNTIQGGASNDVIEGGVGADHMSGGDGNDVYFVDNAGDFVDEGTRIGSGNALNGSGSDFIFTTVDFTLPTQIERLAVTGAQTTQAVNLTGNDLANEISGNDGANVLDGKLGLDTLIGYGGADTFAFTTRIDGANADRVIGFEVSIDKIALDDAVFAGLTVGSLPDGAFRMGGVAIDADDRILYDAQTGYLFFDPDGNGPQAAQFFASMHEGLNLSASDFIVI